MASTIINGFNVEYTPSNDNGLTDCHIWIKGQHTGSTYCASLQLLVCSGSLENVEGHTYEVPQPTINRIEAWAIEQGWSE